jgi:hypothetical protein
MYYELLHIQGVEFLCWVLLVLKANFFFCYVHVGAQAARFVSSCIKYLVHIVFTVLVKGSII